MLSYRPMGIVSGLVNKPNQSAAEIIEEMMTDAVRVLASAGQFLQPVPKL